MGIYISLGSNLGDDRLNSIANALNEIKDNFSLIAVSNLYETIPIDMTGNNFYNCVAKIKTNLTSAELLLKLKDIEKKLGRTLEQGHNLPRIIDLDILLFDEEIVNSPTLTIPHNKLLERPFFIKCLLEIDDMIKDPVSGKKYNDIFHSLYLDKECKKINDFYLDNLFE